MSRRSSSSHLAVSRAPRSTLQDHVYRELCELILDGGIAPGQSVTIQSLATAFGVSTMPVREALQRLTAARVLTVISGRSIGIPPLSKERMLDLRRVRLEVEALAGDWATARMDAADLRKLELLLRKAEKAADEGDRSYIGLNRAIHFTIYRASGSDALVAIIENLWLQVSPYFHFLYSSGNPHHAKKMHGEILEGLRTRDAARVRAGLVADIEAAGRVLDDLLEPESTEPNPASTAADRDRGVELGHHRRLAGPGVAGQPWPREVLAAADDAILIDLLDAEPATGATGAAHRHPRAARWMRGTLAGERDPGGDPWAAAILPLIGGRAYVTVSGILAGLGDDPDKVQDAAGQRIGRILQSLGWVRAQRRIGGKPVRVYLAPGGVPGDSGVSLG